MQRLLAAVLLTVALILLPLPSQSDEQGAGGPARSGGRRRSPNAPQVPAETAAAAKSFAATGCDPSLWDHVYHKQRLVVVEKCISVTGTIYHIKKELDGDDHIQLKLDPEFAKLLNDRNKSAQAGSLVVEPICQNPAHQPDAQPACQDFHSPVAVPSHGTHVKVLGSFVLDAQAQHGWMEIHPVTMIEPVQ